MMREVGIQSSQEWASQSTQTTLLARSTGTNTEVPPREDVCGNYGVAHQGDCAAGSAPTYAEGSEVLSEGLCLLKNGLFDGLSISESSVKGVQYGVFAFKPLPKGLHFGPFHCVKVDNGGGSGHTLQVRRSGEVFLVDGPQPHRASWMHYVNYAPSRQEQNLVAILKDGEIYYRTRRSIIAGEELLVAYNTAFTKGLLGKRRGPGAVTVDSATGVPVRCAFISCDMCGELFTTRQFLDEHRQHKHPQSFPGNHRCAYCSYSSNRRSDVVRHERTHTGERLFACQYCNKGFSRQDNLTLHLLTHTGEKPYACWLCGKRFRERVHALRHESVVHGRQYPLHCPRCGTGAEDVTKLRRHVCKWQRSTGDHDTRPQETVLGGQGHAPDCGEGDALVEVGHEIMDTEGKTEPTQL